MRIPYDNISFAKWLDSQAASLGLEAIACLKLDKSMSDKLSCFYSERALEGMPGYVMRDRPFKGDPPSFAPWAKSAIVAAGSFNSLPQSPSLGLFKMAASDSPTSGLLAGYDLRLDYHIFAREAMDRLSDALESLAGREIRNEAFCDANPLPERAFAILAGLGHQGLHRCLLASSTRDGVFIASLLTELELPERIIPEDSNSVCDHCGSCVAACPNGVVGAEDNPFNYSRCAVAISSEMRGQLDLEQTKALGFWLAGCGECVRACPRSKLPPPEAIDLDWLLNCPTSELDKALAPTSLSYEGSTLLRRNALAVLYNRAKPESINLIRGFRERTGSAKLRAFTDFLLESL